MTEIEVRNQAELDAALERQDVQVRDALIVVCGDGRFVVKQGAPTMEARGSSQPTMVARGSSQPTMEAWGSSQPRMEAWDSSQPRMVAWGSSQPRMVARDSSQPTMEARDSSQPTMEARDSSQPTMEAWDSSQPTMEAWDSSQPRMVAWGSSQPRMEARGSSQPRMEAWGSSQLQRTEPEYLARFFRQDYWSILDQAPAEVSGLRKAITEGRIDGSTYSGECSCLAGTIATVHGCDVDALGVELGIQTDSDRPAEQWFIRIEEGDKPLPLDTKEWPSESVFRASYALAWLDEWVESRTAIAKALTDAA